MKTILLGNGLNRLTYGNSWEELVHSIEEDAETINGKRILLESQIPNTHQFSTKVLQKWFEKNDSNSTLNFSERELKVLIKNEMKDYLPCDLHDMLIQLKPNHIITTNYDYVIDKAIMKSGDFLRINNTDPFQEQKYSIRRCRNYWNNNQKISTWYIHGELEYINSIMLGYDHYCNTLELIDAYLNGTYKYNKRLSRSRSMRDKIIEKDTRALSWIDLFFISDIHILGFGLGYEELDIWYVIMKRRELQIELGTDKICNKIYFYEKGTSKGKRELLEFYNILVVDTDVAPHKEDYSPIYEDLIDKMINNFK